jgi:hypothetical protein
MLFSSPCPQVYWFFRFYISVGAELGTSYNYFSVDLAPKCNQLWVPLWEKKIVGIAPKFHQNVSILGLNGDPPIIQSHVVVLNYMLLKTMSHPE